MKIKSKDLRNFNKMAYKNILDRIRYMKRYRIEHKEKQKEYKKRYREKYPEKYRKSLKRWRENNSEYCKEYQKNKYIENKERYSEISQQWRKNNLERWKKYQNWWQEIQRKTNLKYNLNKKIRHAICQSLRGNKNGWHWEDLVGYTLDGLKKHLNKTMPEGYTWKDYLEGKLHIDHIIPIRVFEFKTPNDKEFKQCWDLYNLRLLTKEQNLLKNDSVNNPILLGLLLEYGGI